MPSFKKIKLTPLKSADEIDVKVANQYKYNLPPMPKEQLSEMLAIANRIVAKTDGAFTTGAIKGETPHVFTQVKSVQTHRKIAAFPEPNPVRIYYSNAVKHLNEAQTAKSSFIAAVTSPNPILQSETYTAFFAEVSLGIVSLVMTVEAFINQLLPEAATYQIDGSTVGKKDIERMDFNKKIREVIPVITGIDYVTDYKDNYDKISLANSKRDSLIHLKTVEKANYTSYQIEFKQLLDIDLFDIANAVFHFVNTIKPDYFAEE